MYDWTKEYSLKEAELTMSLLFKNGIKFYKKLVVDGYKKSINGTKEINYDKNLYIMYKGKLYECLRTELNDDFGFFEYRYQLEERYLEIITVCGLEEIELKDNMNQAIWSTIMDNRKELLEEHEMAILSL